MTDFSTNPPARPIHLPHFLYAPSHKLVISVIPKSACTTIKRWFLSIFDSSNAQVADLHHFSHVQHSLARFSPDVSEKILRTSTLIAFVRNPFVRLASAYVNKFVQLHRTGCFEGVLNHLHHHSRLFLGVEPKLDTHRSISDGIHTWQVPASSVIDYERGMTFREFVLTATRLSNSDLDAHFRPQAAFLDGLNPVFLGRVESLSDILRDISKRLNAKEAVITSGRFMAEAPGRGKFFTDVTSGELSRSNINPSAADLYDDDLRMLVSKRYACDVELWNQARSSLPDDIQLGDISQPIAQS